MWRFSTIPVYIWTALLLPSAVIAIVAGLRRTYFWFSFLAFSLTTVVVAVAEIYCLVFVLKRFNGNFQHAAEIAFRAGLFAAAIMSLLGLFLFARAVAVFTRRSLDPAPACIYASSILGGAYPTLLFLADWVRIDMPAWIFWSWLMLFPIAAARLVLRRAANAGPTTVPDDTITQ